MCGHFVTCCFTGFHRGPNRRSCRGVVKMMAVMGQSATGLFMLGSAPVNEVEQTRFKDS
jgi:hypothetical protein